MHYLANDGDFVNRAANQFMCSSMDDLEAIPQKDIQLGATAIVITDGAVRFFIANDEKKWVEG